MVTRSQVRIKWIQTLCRTGHSYCGALSNKFLLQSSYVCASVPFSLMVYFFLLFNYILLMRPFNGKVTHSLETSDERPTLGSDLNVTCYIMCNYVLEICSTDLGDVNFRFLKVDLFFAGTCPSEFASGWLVSATKMRTAPTSCTPSSHTSALLPSRDSRQKTSPQNRPSPSNSLKK